MTKFTRFLMIALFPVVGMADGLPGQGPNGSGNYPGGPGGPAPMTTIGGIAKIDIGGGFNTPKLGGVGGGNAQGKFEGFDGPSSQGTAVATGVGGGAGAFKPNGFDTSAQGTTQSGASCSQGTKCTLSVNGDAWANNYGSVGTNQNGAQGTSWSKAGYEGNSKNLMDYEGGANADNWTSAQFNVQPGKVDSVAVTKANSDAYVTGPGGKFHVEGGGDVNAASNTQIQNGYAGAGGNAHFGYDSPGSSGNGQAIVINTAEAKPGLSTATSVVQSVANTGGLPTPPMGAGGSH